MYVCVRVKGLRGGAGLQTARQDLFVYVQSSRCLSKDSKQLASSGFKYNSHILAFLLLLLYLLLYLLLVFFFLFGFLCCVLLRMSWIHIHLPLFLSTTVLDNDNVVVSLRRRALFLFYSLSLVLSLLLWLLFCSIAGKLYLKFSQILLFISCCYVPMLFCCCCWFSFFDFFFLWWSETTRCDFHGDFLAFCVVIDMLVLALKQCNDH